MARWGHTAAGGELASRLPDFPGILLGPSRRGCYGGEVHPQPSGGSRPCRAELCSLGHTAQALIPRGHPAGSG